MIETKNHYLPGISFLFSGVLLCINYWGGGGVVVFFNKRPNIFLSGKTNSGETHFKSCDISKYSIWPSLNFDIPQCFS